LHAHWSTCRTGKFSVNVRSLSLLQEHPVVAFDCGFWHFWSILCSAHLLFWFYGVPLSEVWHPRLSTYCYDLFVNCAGPLSAALYKDGLCALLRFSVAEGPISLRAYAASCTLILSRSTQATKTYNDKGKVYVQRAASGAVVCLLAAAECETVLKRHQLRRDQDACKQLSEHLCRVRRPLSTTLCHWPASRVQSAWAWCATAASQPVSFLTG
jgi:hypothetical protein